MRKSGAFESLRHQLFELQEDLATVGRRLEAVRYAAAELSGELERFPVPGVAHTPSLPEDVVERVVHTILAQSSRTQGPRKAYLNTREVAEMMGISAGMVIAWRRKKSPEGPPFVKVGKLVLYPIAELEKHFGGKVVRAVRS